MAGSWAFKAVAAMVGGCPLPIQVAHLWAVTSELKSHEKPLVELCKGVLRLLCPHCWEVHSAAMLWRPALSHQ